jgi:methionine-rich copper-binding protein CopC
MPTHHGSVRNPGVGTLVDVPFYLARINRFPVATVAAVAVVLGGVGGVASAHTDFDYSLPEDGATIESPLSEITVAFSEPVTLVGNGFQVFDPDENILEPPVFTDDDAVFRLQLDPPLTSGVVGVRYEVTSEDGHVVSGSFSFAIDAPPATDAPVTQPPTTEPSTTIVATTATVGSDTAPTSAEISDEIGSTFADDDLAVSDSTVVTSTSDDGGGSNIGVIVAIAAVLVVAAGAVVLLRSRASGGR